MKKLREELAEWTDIDVAQYYMACSLSLMNHDTVLDSFQDAKHVFWTNNEIGNMLYKMLEGLTKTGALEKRDEPDLQYRWNANFKGTWEK